MMENEGGLTVTLTTFVRLPPPQPATATKTRALRLSQSPEKKLRDFMTTRTPKILFQLLRQPLEKVSSV